MLNYGRNEDLYELKQGSTNKNKQTFLRACLRLDKASSIKSIKFMMFEKCKALLLNFVITWKTRIFIFSIYNKRQTNKPFLGHALHLPPHALIPVLSIPQQHSALVNCFIKGISHLNPLYFAKQLSTRTSEKHI